MTDIELNEAVARKLGWHETKTVLPRNGRIEEVPAWTQDDKFVLLDLPYYSTDIKAAWEIIDADHIHGVIRSESGWQAMTGTWAGNITVHKLDPHFCPTAPRAICEAFLKLP